MKKLVEVSILITIKVLKYNFSTYNTTLTLNNSLIEYHCLETQSFIPTEH